LVVDNQLGYLTPEEVGGRLPGQVVVSRQDFVLPQPPSDESPLHVNRTFPR